jgi:AsmA protein
MGKKWKKVVIIAGIVFAVLILIVLAIPFFIDANQFKPTLETDLSTALGRQVEIGNIHLSILSGGVTVDDVSISDDPAFSRSPFLTAKQLKAGVALIPLIFSKQIEVSSFTITDPQVTLLHSPSGVWNFSSLGSSPSKFPAANANASQPPSQGGASSPSNLSVGKLEISNGTIIVGALAPGARTRTYQDVNLEASDLSYTSQFPFSLTAKTPNDGSVKLDGKAGPMNSTDASLTPLDATIEVQHLDIAATGFVDPASGLAGLVDFKGALTSDGRSMNSQGTLKADKIKLVAAGSPSSVPVNLDYDTDYDLKSQKGVLKKGDVHIGSALAHLTGDYDTAGAETTVQMKLAGQGMSVPDLEGVLPALGVVLPSGASLQSGTLQVNLAASGPVDRLTVTGPVNLSNGKLAGFSLKSKLGALGSLFSGLGGGGSSSDTEIQTMSANIHYDPSGSRADNLNLIVPSIGTITGNGTVSPAGKLDCSMNAKLATGNMVGSMTSGLSSLTGGGKSQSGGGIPFKIEGTTSNPVFIPNFGSMATGLAKGGAGTAAGAASAASSIVGGLFGKKKN